MATATGRWFDFSPQLFISFLSGDRADAQNVYRTFTPKLHRWARRWAPELPPDLVEEVAQETWLLVARLGQSGFEASGKPVIRYMIGVMLNALKVIRAVYRDPGTPSRRSGRGRRRSIMITLEQAELVGWDGVLSTDENRVDASIDLSLITRRSGPTVVNAVAVIVEKDITIQEAAAELGVSRQTLSRHLHALATAA